MNKQIAILLIIFFLIFSVSCYTTFKHPQVYTYSDSTNVYNFQQISFIEDCSSCHEQNNPINDAHLQVYDYPSYEENYNWQYYYVIPWWVEESYYEGQRAESKESLPATQRRDFDRREQSPSSATASPGVSGATLSKPTTTGESTPPASPQPDEKKRHERRDAINQEGSKSQESNKAEPTRNKREAKETEKEKKPVKEKS